MEKCWVNLKCHSIIPGVCFIFSWSLFMWCFFPPLYTISKTIKNNFVTKSRSSKIFYQQNTKKLCKMKSISRKLILFVDQKSCCFSIKYVNRMKHLHYSWSLLQWYRGRDAIKIIQTSYIFLSSQAIFLFEKSDLILENVSDKMSYPKQPVILFACLIFNTNKNSDAITKTENKTRNGFKKLF